MGLIREPKNVDLVIPPSKITKQELDELDKAIAQLRAKDKKKKVSKSQKRKRAA